MIATPVSPRCIWTASATANDVVLWQVASEAKYKEITAIPQLLALLHLQGCVITIDAMCCQTKIAGQGGGLRARAEYAQYQCF
jgi:hypothetical protein